MFSFIFKVIGIFFTCICTIISFMQFFHGTDTYADVIVKYPILNDFSFKCVLLVVLFIIITIVQLIIYKVKNNKRKEIGECFHKFHHSIRDKTFEMRQRNDEDNKMDKRLYYSYIKNMCALLCTDIYDFLRIKTGKEFGVCIKMLDVNSLRSDDMSEIEVYTLCRVGFNADFRCQRETSQNKITVRDNSDFKSILSNETIHQRTTAFACSNLKMLEMITKILKKNVYCNSTENYLKDYKSTIVVPIRIDSKYLPDNFYEFENNTFQTIGFLCVDYKKPLSKALTNELFGYVKSFGDAFYELFYEITIYDRSIMTTIIV